MRVVNDMLQAATLSPLLAVFWTEQLVRWIVWVGLVVLTVALLLLVRTRWGQSQPLGKCVVLSLLAHLLLGIYMTTVNIVTATVGSPDGQGIQVALIDNSLSSAGHGEDAPAAPWDSATGDAGGVAGGLPDLSLPAPAVDLPEAREPERAAPTMSLSPPSRLSDPAPVEDAGPLVLPPEKPAPIMRPVETKEAAPIDLPAPAPNPVDISIPAPEPQDTPPVETPRPSGQRDAQPPAKPSDGSGAGSGGSLENVSSGKRAGGGDGLGAQGSGGGGTLPEIYKLRVGDHSQVAKGFGATQESEAAVNAALRFLAANQSADGRWEARRLAGGAAKASDGEDRQNAGMQADTAITGLSLLAFLAAGNTHLRGPHQNTVRRGLEFLLQSQQADGNLGVSNNVYEKMYSHAMATCALSEAYAMTSDQRLSSAVRRAIGFTVAAQDRRGGGWRYHASTPGDTSQLGWQVMALKSAQLAGIPIPGHTRDGIARFLKSVADGPAAGMARYQPVISRAPSRSMTAEALACRQFMGLRDTPAALEEATSHVLQEVPGVGETNHYYWYYATLALYQVQGDAWKRWNEALQKQLLSSQRTDGDLAGSWDPDRIWGGCGGRAYSTALSALCLEVYYRFLPLYVDAGTPRLGAKP